jgi:hypothetical protein
MLAHEDATLLLLLLLLLLLNPLPASGGRLISSSLGRSLGPGAAPLYSHDVQAQLVGRDGVELACARDAREPYTGPPREDF